MKKIFEEPTLDIVQIKTERIAAGPDITVPDPEFGQTSSNPFD